MHRYLKSSHFGRKYKEIALVVIQVLEQPGNVDIAELTVYPTKQTGQGILANVVKRHQ